jgi:hypothetical protein
MTRIRAQRKRATSPLDVRPENPIAIVSGDEPGEDGGINVVCRFASCGLISAGLYTVAGNLVRPLLVHRWLCSRDVHARANVGEPQCKRGGKV